MNETGNAQPAPIRRNHQKVVFVALAVVLLAGGSAWAYHDQTQSCRARGGGTNQEKIR